MLVHPVRHLLGAKRLLAQIGEKGREAGGVEVEEVDHADASAAVDRQGREEVCDLGPGGVRSVGAVHGVRVDRLREIGPDRARVRLFSGPSRP